MVEWNHRSSIPQFLLLPIFSLKKKKDVIHVLYNMYCIFMDWCTYLYEVCSWDCYFLFKSSGFCLFICFSMVFSLFFEKDKGVLFSLAAGKATISLEILTTTGHNSLIFVNLVIVKWYLIIVICLSITQIYSCGYLNVTFYEFSLQSFCLYCLYC